MYMHVGQNNGESNSADDDQVGGGDHVANSSPMMQEDSDSDFVIDENESVVCSDEDSEIFNWNPEMEG